MIEIVVVLLGLILTFLPVLIYCHYLLTHVSKKTRFDYHIELVNDKKGTIGVVFAYAERILFGSLLSSLGIVLSEFFKNELFFKVLIINVVLYVIVKYFDEANAK